VVREFHDALGRSPDMAVAVAAIKALTQVLVSPPPRTHTPGVSSSAASLSSHCSVFFVWQLLSATYNKVLLWKSKSWARSSTDASQI